MGQGPRRFPDVDYGIDECDRLASSPQSLGERDTWRWDRFARTGRLFRASPNALSQRVGECRLPRRFASERPPASPSRRYCRTQFCAVRRAIPRSRAHAGQRYSTFQGCRRSSNRSQARARSCLERAYERSLGHRGTLPGAASTASQTPARRMDYLSANGANSFEETVANYRGT